MYILRIILLCLVLVAIAVPFASFGQPVFDMIAESHIRSNVPDSSDFNTLMVHDLESYFGNREASPIHVSYEMLRIGSTQTGVAYPKFYLWINVTEGNKAINEGAGRVEAIEKQRFEVTHFLSVNDLRTDPEGLYKIFPKPVCDKIKTKIK